jgi:hypothetical protein
MSITTSKDVFCDKCGQWVSGGIETTNRKARKVAKDSHGYQYTNGQDLCPRCQKEPQ